MSGGNCFEVEWFSSVAASVDKSVVSNFDVGFIDLIFPSNDIEESWFLLIDVAIVEGATDAENDLPSAVEYFFFTWWNIEFSNTLGAPRTCLVASTYPHGENYE